MTFNESTKIGHTTPTRSASEMLRALRVRNFALFWIGQLISGTGTWMQTVAMAWLVLDISHSAATLGMVTTLQFLPILLFALPAGVIADRFAKRTLLLATQALATVQALLLGILIAFGTPKIWQLAVLAFTLGISNAFNNPTEQAFIPEMVGHTLVADAVALNSIQFNTTRMVGSALGGLAVAQFGPQLVFFANAATFAASLIALLAMRRSELHVPRVSTSGPGALREGVRYALQTPAVLFVLGTLAVVGTLGFNWPVAVPLLARDVLNVQAAGFGALMAAFGAGSLIAGLGLIILGSGDDRRIIASAGMLSAVLILLGISRSYPFSLILMGLAGITGTTFTTTANTQLQRLVPDRLRGRVMSIFVLLMAGSTPIGASLLGFGASNYGVSATISGFGIATAFGLVLLVITRSMTNRTHPTLTNPDRSSDSPKTTIKKL